MDQQELGGYHGEDIKAIMGKTLGRGGAVSKERKC